MRGALPADDKQTYDTRAQSNNVTHGIIFACTPTCNLINSINDQRLSRLGRTTLLQTVQRLLFRESNGAKSQYW